MTTIIYKHSKISFRKIKNSSGTKKYRSRIVTRAAQGTVHLQRARGLRQRRVRIEGHGPKVKKKSDRTIKP